MIIEVLLGGALSIVGGFIATTVQGRQAQKIRMSEVVAERKVETNRQAYVHMKRIQTLLDSEPDFTKPHNYMITNEDWFFENRLFLPDPYPALWISIRNSMQTTMRQQSDGRGTPESLTNAQVAIDKWAAQAIDAIYDEMRLSRIEVRSVPKSPANESGSTSS